MADIHQITDRERELSAQWEQERNVSDALAAENAKLRKTLQQALVALELSQPARCGQSDDLYEQERQTHRVAIIAIRSALVEQPAQQGVGNESFILR